MTQIPPMQPPMPPGQGYPMGYAQPPQQKPQGLAITSMVLGIVSIVSFCFIYLSIPLGLTAIILALVARPKIARGEAGGRGMATAGLITGTVGLLLAVIVLIMSMVFSNKLMNWAQQQQQKAIQMQQQQQNSTTQPTEVEDTTDATEPADPAEKK